MVLFNCGHPANAVLNLEMANSQPGSFLHRFGWIEDESLIGEIDFEWNFLVECYKPFEGNRKPKAIHYTEGGPWFPDHRCTDYASEWFSYLRQYESTLSQPRQLCPFERYSEKNNPTLEGYANSCEPWCWEDGLKE